ncbi:hypothetical protein [Acrocarpospora phusangensis]|nr:hypothetical protein [Acrocarpospora phusangensis]
MSTSKPAFRILRRAAASAAAITLLAAPASAERNVSATFDDLPTGTAVSGQYAPAITFGVNVLGHPDGVFPVVTRLRSGEHVGRATPETEPSRRVRPRPPSIWGRLGAPASNLSVQVGTFGSRRVRVTLDAYDSTGTLVARATRTVSKRLDNQLRIAVPHAVITTFHLTGGSLAPLRVDNLRTSR